MNKQTGVVWLRLFCEILIFNGKEKIIQCLLINPVGIFSNYAKPLSLITTSY